MISGSIMLLSFSLIGMCISQALQQYMQVLVTHWAGDEYGWTLKEFGNNIPDEISEAMDKYENIVL